MNKLSALLLLPLLALVYWRVPIMPPDFAVKVSGMFHDKVNTFNETYSRGGIKRPAKKRMFEGKLIDMIVIGDSTVPLKLTTQEKREIYSALENMNYTRYPDDISIGCKYQIVPSHKVTLTIRAGNAIKRISYQDGCDDRSKQSKEFRHSINLLYEISHRHQTVQQLPETMMFDL